MFPVPLHPMHVQVAASPVRCGQGVDASAPSLRSKTGDLATLRVHTDDDHGHNTHLCQSEYTLRVETAHGGRKDLDAGLLSDDAWGRKIVYGLEGFTADGSGAVALMAEGARMDGLFVVVFDLRGGAARSFSADPAWVRGLGSCATTLRVAGLTQRGSPVIATARAGECARALSWQITAETVKSGANRVVALPRGALVQPLDPGVPAGR